MTRTKKPTEHPTHSAQHHSSMLTNRQRTIALVIVALAFVMDLLDNTIVNIAIPSIQSNLGASYSAIQWLIAGYSLSFAVLLITGGRMGDVFGYKKLFLIGVGGFTIASLLSGLAWNTEMLIAARLLQGSMAALMVPQVMSLMQVMFKPHERGNVMGIFGALAGVSASLGPVIGGLLIRANIAGLDWRTIFLINIPIGIFALIAAYKYLPDGKSPHPLKLDISGTFIIIIALFLIVFPLIQGRDLGWPLWTFVMMASSLPAFALFSWWIHRKDHKDKSALVPPILFKTKTFIRGIIINLVFQGAMIGFFLPFTLLLQIGLGYEVTKAALTGIPVSIGISVAIGLLGQKLIPKLGRYALTLGAVVMVIGLAITYLFVSHNGLDTSPWQFIPGLLVTGAGMGLVMMPIFSVALLDVDVEHAGSASGVLNAVQQLGGAIGVAVIGVIFFGQLTSHAVVSFATVEPQIHQELTQLHLPSQVQNSIIQGVQACYTDRSKQTDASATPDSCKQLTNAPKNPASQKIGDIIIGATKKANANNFINAFKAGIMYEAVLIAITFALSFALPRYIRRPEADQVSL
ncbi:MAG TPA: MFS transporter [Patescibacteria group bacterium]|jgi:EmrB/QacA subfamily drug resistance transporter|nr:MFS transporter [Patescibacteria group bacterium]